MSTWAFKEAILSKFNFNFRLDHLSVKASIQLPHHSSDQLLSTMTVHLSTRYKCRVAYQHQLHLNSLYQQFEHVQRSFLATRLRVG